jgi:leucyl aminopeptidase
MLNVAARKIRNPAATRTHCAILPLYSDADLGSGVAAQVDAALGGLIARSWKRGDFLGKRGSSCWLPGDERIQRVLLLGCGARKDFDRAAQVETFSALAGTLTESAAADAVLYLDDLDLEAPVGAWCAQYSTRAIVAACYRYSETLSKPKAASKLKKLQLSPGEGLSAARADEAMRSGLAIGEGVNLARELGNLPGNICNPDYLAREARRLSRQHASISSKVLNEKQMRELGMGSLLSVAAGSEQPARLIIMEYKGGKRGEQPVVLVGKGITFDSGGISLKPGPKMDEMKYDMGGAASVFGTFRALAELALPINVVGLVAAAENMPSGRATKPGDVVKSMSGKTIEILNTDAEGRLVLCDALTYAERYKPAAVIDIATLTGACIVALGSHASGLYANDEELAAQLLEAGTETHDRAWRMPLWQDYQKQLKSNFADLANIGGPEAGSVTAACFLARFAEKYPWAHLDIAGAAWNSSPKGATGRPVPLLTRYLQDRARAR